MGEDSEAERILRDREQRRSRERARMEEERRGRRLEISRLRLFELGPGESGETDPSLAEVPTNRVVVVPERDPESARPPVEAPAPGGPGPASRNIGGSVLMPSVDAFLRTDPTEQFDIQALNALRFPDILAGSSADLALRERVVRRTGALMVRVKQEVDDPLNAGAFLREQVIRWYRESPSDADWTAHASERWAGLFAESRVSGGRLQPWLNQRLWVLRGSLVRGGPWSHRFRTGMRRDRLEATIARTASQQIHAEVAQAILDDLAAHARAPGAVFPLVRLSELAVRRQVPTVNETLALLLSVPESGPFVVLHPNRYPDCEELLVRPPTPGSGGAALAYALVPGRPLRSAPGRRPGEPGTSESPPSEGSEEAAIDAASVWQADAVGREAWRQVLEECRRERRRLEAPDKERRVGETYRTLRELLLENAESRKAFSAVRWRGRPAGLPLLVTLLQKGSIAPEVATDHEYLEAELTDAAGENASGAAEGRWDLPGWSVVREGSHREGFRFRAERRS